MAPRVININPNIAADISSQVRCSYDTLQVCSWDPTLEKSVDGFIKIGCTSSERDIF